MKLVLFQPAVSGLTGLRVVCALLASRGREEANVSPRRTVRRASFVVGTKLARPAWTLSDPAVVPLLMMAWEAYVSLPARLTSIARKTENAVQRVVVRFVTRLMLVSMHQ